MIQGHTASRVALIKDYFELTGGDAIREIKALTSSDKDELAAAIARHYGVTVAS